MNRSCGNQLLVLSRCVSTRWSRRVEGDDYKLIGSIDGMTVSDVCISETEVAAMWEYVDGVVSPWTGSDEPFGDHDYTSGTGGPIHCVRTSWTESMECDAFESIGRVLGT